MGEGCCSPRLQAPELGLLRAGSAAGSVEGVAWDSRRCAHERCSSFGDAVLATAGDLSVDGHRCGCANNGAAPGCVADGACRRSNGPGQKACRSSADAAAQQAAGDARVRAEHVHSPGAAPWVASMPSPRGSDRTPSRRNPGCLSRLRPRARMPSTGPEAEPEVRSPTVRWQEWLDSGRARRPKTGSAGSDTLRGS